jgi:surfactin family lipopeptide synthetase C
LAEIWAEVLSIDDVGVHDNFCDLGGHSLAAMRVVSRVIKQFQLELPVQSLFESPTVAEMAAIITANQAKLASDEDLAQMLREVDVMTEEEVQRQLDKITSTLKV